MTCKFLGVLRYVFLLLWTIAKHVGLVKLTWPMPGRWVWDRSDRWKQRSLAVWSSFRGVDTETNLLAVKTSETKQLNQKLFQNRLSGTEFRMISILKSCYILYIHTCNPRGLQNFSLSWQKRFSRRVQLFFAQRRFLLQEHFQQFLPMRSWHPSCTNI